MRLKDFGREKIRTAKAQLELDVAAAVKDKKKASTTPSPAKEGVEENLHPLFSSELILRRKVLGFC